MTISDEKLLAFLEAKLPEAEMEAIRMQLIDDENIANRIAELAMLEEVVAANDAKIDSRPSPNSITAVLAENTLEQKPNANKKVKTANVITFPGFQQFQNALQKHMAITAGVVMVVGLGAINVLHETSSDNNWRQVAEILDVAPSGVEVTANGATIKPRLTFTNKEGSYCRHFTMTDEQAGSENIACRTADKWNVVVSVTVDKAQAANSYRTARGGSLLDAAVENMADGDFLDAQKEAAVIQQHWIKK